MTRRCRIFIQRTLVSLIILAISAGCATDRERTLAEGTALGAGIGAGLGALLGSSIGGKHGAAAGALLGGAAGALGGFAYGNHVANQKERFANQEDYLDAVIESSRQVNETSRSYVVSVRNEIKQLYDENIIIFKKYKNNTITEGEFKNHTINFEKKLEKLEKLKKEKFLIEREIIILKRTIHQERDILEQSQGITSRLNILQVEINNLEKNKDDLEYIIDTSTGHILLGSHFAKDLLGSQMQGIGQSSYREQIQSIPQFPWPPPRASASVRLPHTLPTSFDNEFHLRDVAQHIVSSLSAAGYSDTKFYSITHGFVVVTPLEQFTFDGAPRAEPHRWVNQYVPPNLFSITSILDQIKTYTKLLFLPQNTYYRVIAIVVSPYPFYFNTNNSPSKEEAEEWTKIGSTSLPKSIGELRYIVDHQCHAIIYQFFQQTSDHDIVFSKTSHLTGEEHLRKSGIWKHLLKK